jgi:SAM-dependent methyltransferase
MADDIRPWCNICGHDAPFLMPDGGREGVLCGNCAASSRQRALLAVLGAWLGQDDRPLVAWERQPDLCVLEASGRGAYPMLLAERVRYCNTEFRPNRTGAQRPWQPHADLEHLAYADESLDVVLAADVFEHVRVDERAFREIHRVLRPDGLLLFTVPYEPDRAETLIRVQVDGDRDVMLMEPEYHGGGGQSLAYRTYGRDLSDRLRGFGYSVAVWNVAAPHHAITALPVFVCVKGSYLDLSRFARLASAPRPPGPQSIPLLPTRLWLIAKTNLRALRQITADLRARLGR